MFSVVLTKEGYPDQPEEFGKISVSETPRPPLLELRLAEKLLQLTEREPHREELSQLPPTTQRQRQRISSKYPINFVFYSYLCFCVIQKYTESKMQKVKMRFRSFGLRARKLTRRFSSVVRSYDHLREFDQATIRPEIDLSIFLFIDLCNLTSLAA